MVRKHFLLPQEQIDWLIKESKDSGFSVSEIVRWIINKHIVSSKPRVSASQSKVGDKNGSTS